MKNEVSWANPATAGIVGLCAAVIPLSVKNIGWIPPETALHLIPLLFLGGLVQVICGIIEFRRGGLLLGTPLIVFGLLLTMFPAFSDLMPLWLEVPAVPNHVIGLGVLVVCVYIISLFIVAGLISWLLSVLLLIVDVGLFLVGFSAVGVLGREAYVLGWVLVFIFGLGMLYLGCAFYLNEIFGKQILPVGSPLFKKA